MTITNRRAAWTSVLALATGLLLQPYTALAQAKTTIRAAYIPTTSWLPSWVAKEKGFFAENGLEVTLTPTQNITLLPPTLGKQLDIAPATPPDLIKSAASGLDVVNIAGMTLETSAKRYVEVIVRKDSGITSIKDLKGKVVASPALGAIIHTALLTWLKRNGIDPNSVRGVEVPFPNMGDQLAAKTVDAIEAIQPFVGPLLKNPDNITLGDPILGVADPSLFTNWIAQGAWARANRSAVVAWNNSLKKGIEFIGSNPSEARAILAKYTNLPAPVVQSIPLPHYELNVTPAHLEVWAKALRELDQISVDVDVTKLIVSVQ